MDEEVLEQERWIYFENKTCRLFRDVVSFKVDTWLKLTLADGTYVLVNPEKINFMKIKGKIIE